MIRPAASLRSISLVLFVSAASVHAQDCDCTSTVLLSESVISTCEPRLEQTWRYVCGDRSVREASTSAVGECIDPGTCIAPETTSCPPVKGTPTIALTNHGCRWEIKHMNRGPNWTGCQFNGCETTSVNEFRRFCPVCNEESECEECDTVGESPILIDSRGNRLMLTDAASGVDFDLDADGRAERIAWTVPGSEAAFLALDRNSNGKIDNGTELFGNYSPQPPSMSPNGFAALAEYDVAHGGNGDGWISAADTIFERLLLWTDSNHDGRSQSSELKPVSGTRIVGFDLDYRESRRRDRHGNEFRYLAEIRMDRNTPGPRRQFAVDVFFVTP